MTIPDLAQWLAQKSSPTVWSIAGYDPFDHAGLLRDHSVAQALGCRFYGLTTCITAQNASGFFDSQAVSPDLLHAQLHCAWREERPQSVKVGALGHRSQFAVLQKWLDIFAEHGIAVVVDPVLQSSSGHEFLSPKDAADFYLRAIPKVTLCTPNAHEARFLLEFCDFTKIAPVLLKGGHVTFKETFFSLLRNTPLKDLCCADDECVDVLLAPACGNDAAESTWEAWTSPRLQADEGTTLRGAGCTLSMAIAVALAKEKNLGDACVFAKTYLNAVRKKAALKSNCYVIKNNETPAMHPGPLHEVRIEESDFCRAKLTETRRFQNPKLLPSTHFGFYPLVESAVEVTWMCEAGVRLLQYRNKKLLDLKRFDDLRAAIAVAQRWGALLFVNDDWQAALALGAQGVHLGQRDLKTVDCHALASGGLYCGVSIHCLHELSTALALGPSYISVGPVFGTASKKGPAEPLGLKKLGVFCGLTSIPKIAIGGVTLENAPGVFASGVQGCAVIGDVKFSQNPRERVQEWLRLQRQYFAK